MQAATPTEIDPRRWYTLGVMCLALFMVMLDNTVVNVALPSIQADLHLSVSSLQWIVSGYTLSFGMLLVTGGRLGDLFGRRRLFMIGVAIFVVTSAFIGLAQSSAWIISGRVLQGIGSAMMMPATLSIVSHAFPPQERGKAIGTWAGISALALALGPIIGGFLVEHVSWQSIFYLNVPIACIALVITPILVKESRDEQAEKTVDLRGVTLLTVGIGALVLALIEGNEWGWQSGTVFALFALAIFGVTAFFFLERRAHQPMVDLTFFKSRSFLGANIAAFAVSYTMIAVFFFMALYMQNVLGYTPLQAGIRFLPTTLAVIVVGPIAGKLSDHIGARVPVTVGLVLITVALTWQSFLTKTSDYNFLLGGFILTGIGIGLVMAPMSTAAMNSIPTEKAGVGSGILSMVRMIGGTFGVATLGALMTAVGKTKLGNLLPTLSGKQIQELSHSLGTRPHSQAAVDTSIISAGKEAFIYSLSHGLRLGAAVSLLGAIATYIFIQKYRREPIKMAEEVPQKSLAPDTVLETV